MVVLVICKGYISSFNNNLSRDSKICTQKFIRMTLVNETYFLRTCVIEVSYVKFHKKSVKSLRRHTLSVQSGLT